MYCVILAICLKRFSFKMLTKALKDTLSQRGLLWPVVLVVILCIAAFLLACAIRSLLRALPIGLTA